VVAAEAVDRAVDYYAELGCGVVDGADVITSFGRLADAIKTVDFEIGGEREP